MFVITCPYCGPRDQSEFTHAGEAHIARPEWRDDMTDAEWAEFVFMRKNTKGPYAERWVHSAGCRKFFNAIRNTASDEFLAVYEMGAPMPKVAMEGPSTPSGEPEIGSGNDAAKIVYSDQEGAQS